MSDSMRLVSLERQLKDKAERHDRLVRCLVTLTKAASDLLNAEHRAGDGSPLDKAETVAIETLKDMGLDHLL